VDNLKDATAERIKLENGTLALSEAIAADGRRPEETLRIRSRDNSALVAAGLPPILGAIPTTMGAAEIASLQSIMEPIDVTPATPAIDTATELEDS
jgi:capsid protein